jgi:hypothetical protein
MVRQCAWCLCLINSTGEHITLAPVPKVYEASHGICDVCSALWLEAVGESIGSALMLTQTEDGQHCVQYKPEAFLAT